MKFNMIFLDKHMMHIDGFQTIGEFVDIPALRQQKNPQLKFDEERTQQFDLNDNEIIVGVELGVDKKGNISYLRFILAKLIC